MIPLISLESRDATFLSYKSNLRSWISTSMKINKIIFIRDGIRRYYSNLIAINQVSVSVQN